MTSSVLLAMSGGTDSSVAAMLLQEQGYKVKGVTFITHHEADNQQPQYITNAQQLAQKLNIEHTIVDISEQFKQEIIDYFVSEYAAGRTPNPCVKCNETIKWAKLHDLSIDYQCDFISTGHYINIVKQNGLYYIGKGADKNKDQSYFLWRLPQHILSHAILPLGNFTKQQVKAIALERGFKNVSTSKESMGICFLANSDVNSFLKQNLLSYLQQPGDVIDKSGTKIGTHNGAPFYTIGQKKGLNLNEASKGYCVHKISPDNGLLIAGKAEDLMTDQITLSNYYFADVTNIRPDVTYQVRIRGVDSVPFHLANVEIADHQLKIKFHQPVWAITPGQSIVVYQNELVLGGGIVE
jgi:tRNA-specific 2-thiouridylase